MERRRSWLALCLALSLMHLSIVSGELRYTVLEEQKPGSVVGNIARDLTLSAMRITEGHLQVVSGSNSQYFEINPNGVLVIRETIDRERICALSSICSLHLQILLQDPLEIHRILVQIDDVNDNAPQFPNVNSSLEISEAAAPGTRFRLESARDPDVGINSLRTYSLSSSDYFVLNVETKSDGSKFPELVLEKALDREAQAAFRLSLTAVDGGQPGKSGSTLLLIKILDVNDNAPVFDEPVKRVSFLENSPPGTPVTKLNATDLDSGINGEISYLFSKYTPESILQLFSVDSQSGEIRVVGDVDYEEAKVYDITVQARDGGSPAMEGSCNIKVEIIDVNDNTPEVTLTSLTSPIREDAETGTVIALISAKDFDSGDNGKVTLTVSRLLPFKLKSAFGEHYTLVTDGRLDREVIDEYTVVVTATDSGSPPLSSQKTFTVRLSDVNDNAAVFSQNSYSVDVAENNTPGTPIVTVSASDPDVGDNARLSYSILPTTIQGSLISSYVYINPENGNIFTMRSLDYEQMNAFKIEVQVRDAGAPPQTSNVTVHVFVVDQNDNPPIILYPTHSEDEGLQLTIPHGAPVGHRVNKIVAVDPDSGHNAWLFYSIAPGDDSSLFHIETHTGELRTAQKLIDDEQGGKTHPSYNFIVVVQDNGQPALSTSISVTVTVEEKSADKSTDFRITPHKGTGMTDITLYLIISLGCVSLVSLLTMVVVLVRCIRHKGGSACCYSRTGLRSRHNYQQRAHKDLHLQLNTDGPIRYMEVVGGPQEPHTRTYRPYYSTLSSRSDFVFVKTPMLSHNNTLNMTLTRKHLMNSANEQKPPNADWRFTQNQRPGPSGSFKLHSTHVRWTPPSRLRAAATPEVAVGTGPWPNPPTEAEQLQALMAAANEVSEATNTLGPGTMGLSTRYNPQFTLQHVPDYRQNVYIPGSTATLTSNQQQPQQALSPQQAAIAAAAAQPEPPKAAQTPASKKKSTKKEKK
ncbi:protocadherin gamma-C5-like isoform X16 [Carassius carassius]|uniref:protocadherin gamma-C5-like isoform X16 n=1 Tax=Carassius carassius TaxID=217509 RepID=UPI002868922D|nr:protocadherin gamma-C5-like isoform X16 [Carassius carassius]